ncbi:MarR family transcriptional regulator [Pseudofrankia sp. BMG5.36]|uniref:MarR family winged helix-turn-helix transcriptional regulator n=1 Tax=Pseudofrankia sp. BMG5.36 TaxID=1834512 RepID=UPI0008D9E08D|nr:MarR family transcriptional regulator [Pseudofrankia sp. BMG5.36]
MDSDDHITWLLKQASHYTRRAVNDAIRGYGVTSEQIGVLRRLAETPGLSGADLARRLLITPQASQLALATLERRGLIERKPDRNHGRILRAYLTEKGLSVTTDCVDEALKSEEKLLEVFDAAEQETLRELLRRLTARMPPDGDPAADDDAAANGDAAD